jgi:uncharacterized membrane protein YbaN (DUF454 family)
MYRTVLRWAFFGSWWAFVVLGAIGVLLPVLPTGPFLLLAAACFNRSPPRFHQWLLSTKLFGPLIKNWQQERFIEKRSKRAALVVVAATFSLSVIMVKPIALKPMLAGFWATCTFFIGRLSTVPKSQQMVRDQRAVITWPASLRPKTKPARRRWRMSNIGKTR